MSRTIQSQSLHFKIYKRYKLVFIAQIQRAIVYRIQQSLFVYSAIRGNSHASRKGHTKSVARKWNIRWNSSGEGVVNIRIARMFCEFPLPLAA